MDARIAQALEIATELDATIQSINTTQSTSLYATIQDTDGRFIQLSFDTWHTKGRIQIRGDYPKAGTHRQSWDHAITVSQKRTAAAIAADITRRFYPEFVKNWDKAVAEAKRHDDKVAAIRKAAAEIWEVLELRPNHHGRFTRPEEIDDTNPRFYSNFSAIGRDISISTYPDVHISIERLDLTIPQAVQLAHILGE